MRGQFRQSQPDLFNLGLALFIGLAVFAIGSVPSNWVIGGDPATLLMRISFGIAFSLLMFDVLEGAYIARSQTGHRMSAHKWVFGFYMGYFWAVLMTLFNWQGTDSAIQVLLTWGGAGVLFGGLMATVALPKHAPLTHIFDLERPTTSFKTGVYFYFGWPIVTVVLMAGLLAFPPDEGWTDSYILFMLVFAGSIMPLFPRKSDKHWFFASWSRSVGLAFLLLGLLWLSPTA